MPLQQVSSDLTLLPHSSLTSVGVVAGISVHSELITQPWLCFNDH